MTDQGEVLLAEFERTGDVAVLRSAVTALEDGPSNLLTLAQALRLLGEETADAGILGRAADAARRVCDAAPPNTVSHRMATHALALALWAQADVTGETDVLRQTVETLRSLNQDGANDPGRPLYLANYGLALRDLFNITGEQATLAQAVTVLREAESAVDVDVDDDDRAAVSMNLALALQDWCEQTGALPALDEAIERTSDMLTAMDEQHPWQPSWASNLSAMYQDRFEWTNDATVLHDAVFWARAAVSGTADDHPALPSRLTHLGLALRMLYEVSGDAASLQEAVQHSRKAVVTAGPGHAKYPVYASNLASALRFEYEHTGMPAVLDEAIEYAEQAERLTSPEHHRYAGYASNLSLALWTRYERSGHLASLRDAVGAARRAVDRTDTGHPDANRYRTNLGLALWTLAEREPDSGGLDESILVLREILDRTPDGHAERARFAGNVANAYWTRYERGHHRSDLDAALDAAGLAYRLTTEDHVDHATRLGNLGVLTLARYRHGGVCADLTEAVRLLRAAVALPGAKDFDHALHKHNLAEALAEAANTAEQIAEALTLAQQASEDDRAPVRLRIQAARTTAALTSRQNDPQRAVQALTAAVDLLPELAGASVDQADQENALLLSRGIGPQAAAAALTGNDPGQACQLLERSRGVLLRAVTDPHASHRALRDAAPDLADLLVVQTRPALQRIRSRPDLAAVFAPAPHTRVPEDLGGPVVVINVDACRSDALIVLGEDIEVVRLPAIDPNEVDTRVGGLRRAVQSMRDAGRSTYRVVEKEANALFTEVLAWLGQALVDPVLERLAGQGPLPHRLWWSPTGGLTQLPLHAAVPADADIITSYAPSLRLLADTTSRHREPGETLVVATADDLPSLPREIAAVTRRHPGSSVLTGSRATRDEVIRAVTQARIAHFCTHGIANPHRPSLSGLELADTDLTVEDISRLPLSNMWLTYLSACSTAEGSDLLPDESLTVATAFAVAGAQHVVAALWPVSDHEAADVADAFHTALGRGLSPAAALHEAVTRLRSNHPNRPAVWAPFVHLGP